MDCSVTSSGSVREHSGQIEICTPCTETYAAIIKRIDVTDNADGLQLCPLSFSSAAQCQHNHSRYSIWLLILQTQGPLITSISQSTCLFAPLTLRDLIQALVNTKRKYIGSLTKSWEFILKCSSGNTFTYFSLIDETCRLDIALEKSKSCGHLDASVKVDDAHVQFTCTASS